MFLHQPFLMLPSPKANSLTGVIRESEVRKKVVPFKMVCSTVSLKYGFHRSVLSGALRHLNTYSFCTLPQYDI